KFIDSNSIMFDKGRPMKAIYFWNSREKRPGVLDWHPQYAEISESGDFGYTTGPWTFRASPKDSVEARGQYSTVWYLNKNGEWKFLVDFGIDNTQPGSDEEIIIDTPKEPENTKEIPRKDSLIAAENSFNKLMGKNKDKAYKTWLSSKSILTRNGFLPAANSADRKIIIDSTPPGLMFSMNGKGISAVPDMGYTYGSVISINGKPENYLHIWRREKSGWKIAVEVLRY
ncbi:MAG TPA: hypothetical protein VIV35_10895, partial [Chitinophagaceae bacterium]